MKTLNAKQAAKLAAKIKAAPKFKFGDIVVSTTGFKGRVIGYVGYAPDKMCVRVESKNDCRDILSFKLKHV